RLVLRRWQQVWCAPQTVQEPQRITRARHCADSAFRFPPLASSSGQNGRCHCIYATFRAASILSGSGCQARFSLPRGGSIIRVMSRLLNRLRGAIMAKRQRSAVLNRLAGKKLVFDGKFGYGALDSLKAMADAQQGTVRDDLDAKMDYLVLADVSASKTIQKKAMSLNAKGASIQVIDADAFKTLVEPTDEEIVALLKAGESETYTKTRGPRHYYVTAQPPTRTIASEDFGAAHLEKVDLDGIAFDTCRFVGAELSHVRFGTAIDCDFSRVKGEFSRFGGVPKCRFKEATLNSSQFEGNFSEADFSNATLEQATFSGYSSYQSRKRTTHTAVVFARSKLKSAIFYDVHAKGANFEGADLTEAQFQQC